MDLHLTVLFAHHNHHTSQSVDYGDVTVPKICALKKQLELDSSKETNPEAPTINLKDISKTYEAMIQYLCGISGCDGVSLSYVARSPSDIMPIVEEDDPSNI